MLHRRSLLTIVCIVAMVLPACSRRKSVAITPMPIPAGQSVTPARSGSLSDYIRAVLKISQENTVALEGALAELHKRRPELAALAEHVNRNGNDTDTRKMLAAAYLEEGFRVHALQLYQEALSISPRDSVSETGVARVWDGWGDYQLARHHAERAVANDPSSPIAHEMLGRIHLHRFELDRALRSFLAAVDLSPNNASLLANAGYTYMTLNNMEQARNYLERAVEIDARLVEARNNLGIVLARMGDAEGALEEFTAVGDPATAYNNLGVVFLAQKQWREARNAFRQALALNPEYEKARASLAEAESHLPPPAVVYLSEAPKQEDPEVIEKPVVSLARKNGKAALRTQASRPRILPGRDLTKMSRFTAAYRDALSRFQGGRYNECIEILQWLLLQRPNHPLASNCQYWIGESYFGLGEYSKALAAFKQVNSYSGSPKRRDARIMMNRAYAKMKQNQRPRTVRTSTSKREVGKKPAGRTAAPSKSI